MQGLCKGIYPQNMALYGTVPPFKILDFPSKLDMWGFIQPISTNKGWSTSLCASKSAISYVLLVHSCSKILYIADDVPPPIISSFPNCLCIGGSWEMLRERTLSAGSCDIDRNRGEMMRLYNQLYKEVPPSDVCWFKNPINYRYIANKNHRYWSYVHQLSELIMGHHRCRML